ncbi:HNH endonuclease [Actinomyces oris]|uniref:HNH endonuclease n=1 Tax=Actinomyces oris TaxID=544580 RepID=A0A1Q8VWD6_9ACTO|nr:HNH endonuclease signature motif containing protein [Actinomyces oris]OLO52555.1 HNH endonuclease [Actinomyces oris]
MFESGVLPHVPADGAAGMLSAPAQDASAGAATCAEDVAGLLGSLAAGGALAGVVEGLLARLLVTAQNHHDGDSDGGGDGDGAGSVDSEGLFAGDSGDDAALVAGAEELRVVSVEEAGATGLLGLGARGLGELAAACHRLAAWATWGQSLAAACLTACGELSSHPGQWGPDGRVSEVVGYQERRFNATCLLSARLGLSRSRAGQIVDHGSALMDTGFGPTEAMERCGVLDAAKASLVTRRLEGVPTLVALAVQERVLPQAPRRSVSQVGRDIERALMETDPTGHAERARANQERRCVSRPRPAGEGVSQVRLLLPTMDALLLDATLDAIAASARAAGERRTLGQLRADAITAMTLSTLRTSQQDAYTQPALREAEHHGKAQAEANGSGPAAPARLLPDGVPLEGLLGTLSSLVGSTSPWWTPSGTGHLPLPENVHVDVQVTVPLNSLTDPGGLAQIEDPTDPALAEHDPGGRDPATSGRTLPSSSGVSLPEPGPTTPAFSCSAAHDSSPAASLSTAPIAQPAASTSASTSASLSASPAEVTEVRIGARSAAVPAMTAWALAAGGTWKRLITDPTSGTVIDMGRTRYRPPAGLADLVRARDRACVFPTCQTPAERCDIDHLTAWSQGGTTSLDNLVVLCEAHHRLKHTPGWALTRDQASGTLSWHTPDKTVYQRHPDGTITRHPKRVGPHQRYVPGSVVPADLSQQISPDILNRLNRALDRTLDNQAHNHTSLSTNTNTSRSRSRSGRARFETRGPRPGQRAGDYEPTPYPQAAHTLGLAPLIDEAPPF